MKDRIGDKKFSTCGKNRYWMKDKQNQRRTGFIHNHYPQEEIANLFHNLPNKWKKSTGHNDYSGRKFSTKRWTFQDDKKRIIFNMIY